MADGNTREDVNEKVVLDLTFIDSRGCTHTVTEELIVITSPQQIIVGLPTLVLHLLPLFVSMLTEASVQRIHLVTSDIILPPKMPTDELVEPWTQLQEEESPEEKLTPEPVSFRDVLHYLTTPYPEAKKEYLGLLEEHVAPRFAKETPIMELLSSNLALDVFLPQTWEGVKNIPLVWLKLKPGMPSRVKPPARPINPRLYADTK